MSIRCTVLTVAPAPVPHSWIITVRSSLTRSMNSSTPLKACAPVNSASLKPRRRVIYLCLAVRRRSVSLACLLLRRLLFRLAYCRLVLFLSSANFCAMPTCTLMLLALRPITATTSTLAVVGLSVCRMSCLAVRRPYRRSHLFPCLFLRSQNGRSHVV